VSIGNFWCQQATSGVTRQLLRPGELLGADFEMRHQFGRLFNEMKNVTQCFTYVNCSPSPINAVPVPVQVPFKACCTVRHSTLGNAFRLLILKMNISADMLSAHTSEIKQV
jgi:hypothetical protein